MPLFEAAGHSVDGLDARLVCRLSCCQRRSIAPPKRSSSSQLDMRDSQVGDFEGYDAIVHLAALSNDPLGNLNPELTHEINYKASLRLAHLAREAGVSRFLFSSSCSTYGAAGDGFSGRVGRVQPGDALRCPRRYGWRNRYPKWRVTTSRRPFSATPTAYGASPRLRLDLVLNNLVGWAHLTGKVRLLSDGSAWRPIVHVEDIARAFSGGASGR